jgi:ABC-type transporter Mla subunit MlaD
LLDRTQETVEQTHATLDRTQSALDRTRATLDQKLSTLDWTQATLKETQATLAHVNLESDRLSNSAGLFIRQYLPKLRRYLLKRLGYTGGIAS